VCVFHSVLVMFCVNSIFILGITN